MAKIEEYLKMNREQLEGAIVRERAKIKKAKTEIALLEKLKIASQESKKTDEHPNHGNEANVNDGNGEFQHQ